MKLRLGKRRPQTKHGTPVEDIGKYALKKTRRNRKNKKKKKHENFSRSNYKHENYERLGYFVYIESDRWKIKRDQATNRVKNKCEECGSPYDLQVHHLTYARLGNENLKDLKVLCRDCHIIAHEGKLGMPLDSLTEEYKAIVS